MRLDTWIEDCPSEMQRSARKRKVADPKLRSSAPPVACVTSPSMSPEMTKIRQELAEVNKKLVSVEAMLLENATMMRSVLLNVNSPGPTATPCSQGSMLSSPSAGRDSKSYPKKSTAGNVSNGTSSLSDHPGYAKMVEELSKVGSTFRVRFPVIVSLFVRKMFD